jgi:hypothetical protein
MALGPAKLEVRDCVVDMSRSAIMKLVLREGCIGETVAALEAVEGAATATDPVIKGVLRRMARDEHAHAELGYRFLAWALAQSSAEGRREVAQDAAQQLIAFEREALNPAQSMAVREVVRPLVAALFAAHGAEVSVAKARRAETR